MTKRHQVETNVLIDCFYRACLRLFAQSPGSSEAFGAAFEALAWVGTIRDRLVDDGLAIPAMLDGLYYMRNVVLHQGADVLSWLLIPGSAAIIDRGVVGRMRLGEVEDVKGWYWPASNDFTPPQSRTGELEFRTLLAEVDVAFTFEQVIEDLRQVWARSGHDAEGAEG